MNVGHVIKQCLAGLYSLLRDPAGCICLLTLCAVSFLCFRGKVGDVAFASVASAIPLVIGMLKHKSFTGSDIDQCAPSEAPKSLRSSVAPLPPRGSL